MAVTALSQCSISGLGVGRDQFFPSGNISSCLTFLSCAPLGPPHSTACFMLIAILPLSRVGAEIVRDSFEYVLLVKITHESFRSKN